MTITMENRIKVQLEEIRMRDRYIKRLDKIIKEQDEQIVNLEQACDEYDNLMRECIFDR